MSIRQGTEAGIAPTLGGDDRLWFLLQVHQLLTV